VRLCGKLRGAMNLKEINTLAEAFSAGKLQLLVGAGPSIQSGFPGWGELNLQLVKNYLIHENRHPRQTVDELAKKLCDTLGRDAIADMVYRNARQYKLDFNELLAEALYGERTLTDLPIHSIHYQIAVMRSSAAICTTNFDPLLEMAVAAVSGVSIESEDRLWRGYREPQGGQFRRDLTKGSAIVHLHGWVDPDGKASEPVIIRESQYQELAQNSEAWANKELLRILQGGPTLIIGMSLGDPNLRRLFYFLGQTTLSEQPGIWAILKKQDALLDDYVKGHWDRLGVTLLFVDEHTEIPRVLRDVQYGICDRCAAPNWINQAITRLQSHVKTDMVQTQDFHEMADCAFQLLRERVRRFFAVPTEELIGFSLFLPLNTDGVAQPCLFEVCSSREQKICHEQEQHGQVRKLSIARGNEQGLAGVAFTSSKELTILDDPEAIYRNFDREMRRIWRSEIRDWRSLLALPVMDQSTWLPIGVVVTKSNYAEPFWTRFGQREDRYKTELYAVIRETASFILGGFREIPGPPTGS
jgi:hypothetical protein